MKTICKFNLYNRKLFFSTRELNFQIELKKKTNKLIYNFTTNFIFLDKTLFYILCTQLEELVRSVKFLKRTKQNGV